jgi:hypothetical protein
MADDDAFRVLAINPGTGIKLGEVGFGLTKVQVADILLTRSGFEAERLAGLAVVHDDTEYLWSAERWLEDNPVIAVRAAWMAGAKWARDERQKKMHGWWPALAMALDNLETNHAEA